jgi:hypothetical protein
MTNVRRSSPRKESISTARRKFTSVFAVFVVLGTFVISLWPMRLRAQVPSDSAAAAPAIDKPAQYELNDIPAQLFWYGSPISFRVYSLKGGPPYQVSSEPRPVGVLSIESQTGLFSFAPANEDSGDYHITFSYVGSDGVLLRKQINVTLLKGMRPEYELVSRPRKLPPAESSDYITVTETPDPIHRDFNTQHDRKVVDVTISGKTIVLDAGADDNRLVSRFFSNRFDIRTIAIYAESIIIRSKLVAPQTSITFFARELRFEDRPGAIPSQINTTPTPWLTVPGVHVDGLDGLPGGSAYVVVQSFRSDPGQSKRFILNGSDGQAAGPGQNGADGTSMACYQDKRIGNTCTVHIHVYAGPTTFGPDNVYPGDGRDAIPPGRPGSPGAGGNFSGNIASIDAFVENDPGRAGKKAADVNGGGAGQPTHALYLEINPRAPGPPPPGELSPFTMARVRIESTHDSKPGNRFAAPDAKFPQGRTGTISKSGSQWLHPFALRAILNYTEDAYLGGNLDYSANVIEQYEPIIIATQNDLESFVNRMATAKAPGMESELQGALDNAKRQQVNFSELQLEMESIRARIVSHLDYFGHPAGWVPQLSLDASLRSFTNEIDAAIPILYLSYYVEQSSADRERHLAGLQESVDKLQADASDAASRYNEAQANIPELSTAAENVQAQITLYQEKVENRKKELVAEAERQVEEAHEVPFWKQALNTLSAAASVFPLGQPVVGSIGTGLHILANVDENTPLQSLQETGNLAKDFTKANFKKSEEDFHSQVALLDPGKADNAKDYVKNLLPLAEKLGAEYSAVNSSLQTTQAPSSEVDAAVAKLEATDSHFNSLVNDLSALNTQKEAFVQKLTENIQLVSSLNSTIFSDWQSIDSINMAVSNSEANLDHEAVLKIKALGQRTRDRLLKYQYYLAKAYEYRVLKPYDDDLNLNRLTAQITTLLQGDHGANLSEKEFSTLKGIYVESVRELTGKCLDDFQQNPPAHRLSYPYLLSVDQINSLNKNGYFDLDLGAAVPHYKYEENRRLNGIEVADIKAAPISSDTSDSNIRITFDHWGTSTFRSAGHSFLFDHRRSAKDEPFEWGGLYDGDAHVWAKQAISPSYVSTLQTLLILEPERVGSFNLFVLPGLDSWITIRREGGFGLAISRMKLAIDYDFDRGTIDEVALNVIVPNALKTLVGVAPADDSGRSTGQGSFTRAYPRGARVTLTAPTQFGDQRFAGWDVGGTVTSDRTLSLSMDSSKSAKMVLEPLRSP